MNGSWQGLGGHASSSSGPGTQHSHSACPSLHTLVSSRVKQLVCAGHVRPPSDEQLRDGNAALTSLPIWVAWRPQGPDRRRADPWQGPHDGWGTGTHAEEACSSPCTPSAKHLTLLPSLSETGETQAAGFVNCSADGIKPQLCVLHFYACALQGTGAWHIHSSMNMPQALGGNA